jgi:hypothetical protein
VRPLPLTATARALYAELQEQALLVAATSPIGASPGSVVRKEIRGRVYLYFQVRDLDGRVRQHYLGPQNDEPTAGLVAQLEGQRRDRDADADRLDALRAAFVAAGGAALPAGPFRVIQAFAQAGLLVPGTPGVLVGTHAFHCLGNLLGVRWPQGLHTQDVDVAAERERHVELAVAQPTLPAPDVLEQLAMGFMPVPTLDPRSPSTSYMVRGAELRVDLLTPLRGKAMGPVFVPAFGAPASPVRHLDFLLVDAIASLAIGPRGLAVVQVPHPARFALHKLMVSMLRPAVFATKAEKDRTQALLVLAALIENAPDDVTAAWTDLVGRGPGWRSKVESALGRARAQDPTLVDEVRALCGGARER